MISKFRVVLLTLVLTVSLAIVSFSAMARTVTVSASGNSGSNTFRAAIERANKDSLVESIRFQPRLNPIELKTPVTYTGTRPL